MELGGPEGVSRGLAYGVFSTPGGGARVGAGHPDGVVDLAALGLPHPRLFGAGGLEPLMVSGPSIWAEVGEAVSDALEDGAAERALVPWGEVVLHRPFTVADYVDFYSSEVHAANLGRILRPDREPILPNWRRVPVGYHGRAGTVVVSGTPIRRPRGQRPTPEGIQLGPTGRLDFELEVGLVVGMGSELGEPVPIEDFERHVFGLVLVNDWSARDIQMWESQPLGPFLGKSFATSMSAWVVPLSEVAHLRVAPPTQHPTPLSYLRPPAWALDLHLEAAVSTEAMRRRGEPPAVVSTTNLSHLYWTMDQQLAHLTVNGASLRTGDLCATGTVSGRDGAGSLIEITDDGHRPIELPDGSTRTFLEDGDEVVLRGWWEGGELGEVRGVVVG